MNEILQGNALDVLKTLESESVNCVITSPPYFGLRNYKTPPQILGLQKKLFIKLTQKAAENIKPVVRKAILNETILGVNINPPPKKKRYVNKGWNYDGKGRGKREK